MEDNMENELNLMKELKFDEVINHTLDLYKKNFMYFIKILSYFFVPAVLFVILFTVRFMDKYTVFFKNIDKAKPGDFPMMFEFMGYAFLLSIVYIVFIIMVNASVIKGIDEKLNGRNTPESEVALSSLKKIFPLFFTSVIAFIMMGFGMLFCIIPFFILAVYLTFIPQAVMLENKSAFSAIGRTFSLVNGRFWAVFVIPVVFFLVYSFISSIITYSMLIVPYIELFKNIIDTNGQTNPDFMVNFYSKYGYIFVISGAINVLLMLLMTPILNIALTLKFYSIKNLKEGASLINDINQEKTNPV
jgi:hypothetical protein